MLAVPKAHTLAGFCYAGRLMKSKRCRRAGPALLCLMMIAWLPSLAGGQVQTVYQNRPASPVQDDVVWVTGVVQDTEGKPIEGADIYALATYHGGLRMYGLTSTARTDADGRYEIRGKGDLSAFSATMVAHAPDHTPAMGYIRRPDPEHYEDDRGRLALVEPPVECDFVLAGGGGSLEVRLVDGDLPAQDETVHLFRAGGQLRDHWALGGQDEIWQKASALTSPASKTDADGIARFKHLIPGTYFVTVGSAATEYYNEIDDADADDVGWHYAQATDVPVRNGETTKVDVAIAPGLHAQALRVLQPDGQIKTGDVGQTVGGWGGFETLSEEGLAHVLAREAGLFPITYEYKIPATTSSPKDPPVYRAEIVLPASAILERAGVARGPTDITARFVDLPTVSVKLLDEDGNALPGSARIGWSFRKDDRDRTGTTNASGVVEVKDVSAGRKTVWAEAAENPAPHFDHEQFTGDIPADASLANRVFFPPAEIKIDPETNVSMVAQQVAASYVKVSAPMLVGDERGYAIGRSEKLRNSWRLVHDPETGDVYAGPFPDGDNVTLNVWASDGGKYANAGQTIVTTVGGELTIAELGPPPPPAEPSESDSGFGAISLGVGGVSAQAAYRTRIDGRVTLADGTTPAFGARIAYFPPGYPRVTFGAVVDAGGNVRPRAQRFTLSEGDEFELPDHGLLIAMLPGRTGATILEVEEMPETVDLKLPPAIDVAGQVTIGEAKFNSVPGTTQVYAKAQSNDPRVTAVQSRRAAVRPDGSFVLAGLAPGEYRVQAVLDGIWLSRSVALVVSTEGETKVPALTIAQPAGGATVIVTTVDGQPAPGVQIEILRPDGPARDATWPAAFITDGAGRVHVPALEIGEHVVRLVDHPEQTAMFTIVALPNKPEPINLTVPN